jgi:hypothetical protein
MTSFTNTIKSYFLIYRSFIKRSLSDGNILCKSDSPAVSTDVGHEGHLSEKLQGDNTGLSESTPEISTCESDISYCRSVSFTFSTLAALRNCFYNFGFPSQNFLGSHCRSSSNTIVLSFK